MDFSIWTSKNILSYLLIHKIYLTPLRQYYLTCPILLNIGHWDAYVPLYIFLKSSRLFTRQVRFLECYIASLISREIGIKKCRWWSFLTKKVTIHMYLWVLINPCMVGDVDLWLDCLKWVSLYFWVSILFIRLLRRFIL